MPPMDNRLLRPRAGDFGPFDPASISGLRSWLDFADTATLGVDNTGVSSISVGDPIGFVADKTTLVSGGSYTQTDSNLRPQLGLINGKGACDFWAPNLAANADRLNQTNHTNFIQREFSVVFTWDPGVNTTFADYQFVSFGGSPGAPWVAGSGSNWATSGIFEVVFLNNTQYANATGAAFPTIASGAAFVLQGWRSANLQAFSGVVFGNDRGLAGRTWPGRIGEVLIYNRELTATERLAIRRGLMRKWGIT
jgi:hypothetical protein